MIDWSKAPDGAEFYAYGLFRREGAAFYDDERGAIWKKSNRGKQHFVAVPDYCERPKEWPETDERINNIGRNRTEDDLGHYQKILSEKLDILGATPKLKTSIEYLYACAAVQSERGKQYDAGGTGERSFSAAASAFNAATGKSLTGSDVCLLLTMVKLVRQYSSPDRLHHDSLLDGVSYLSLWAEELTKELGA